MRNLPDLPTSGDVLMPNTIDSVGSSTVSRGSGRGSAASQIVSPISISSIPLTAAMSPAASGPAVPVFCMYLVAAERQGADLGSLDGTLQTDIFKEYIAQKCWCFPPEPSLRAWKAFNRA